MMKQSNKSVAEDLLAIHLRELTKRKFFRHTRVCTWRKWEWDFIIPSESIAIEVDGYFKGRHGAGWGADNPKRNTGTMLGWRVLVFSTKDVLNGTAKDFLKEWL